MMNRYEMMGYYNQYVEAATAANKAFEAFENVKDFYNRGFADEERVRAAEEKYLAAKAEADRLWRLSECGPQQEQGARWTPGE